MNHELRIMVFILICIILASLFLIHPVYAQTTQTSAWEESKPTSQVLQPLPTTVSPASPLYTDLLVNNLFHSFSCLAIGQSIIGQPCLSYQVTKNAQGMIQSVPVLSQTNLSGGALGATTGLIGALYQNPPVRTADYLASLGGGFGIIRQANAQAGVGGSGAAVLNPIISLWQVSRNISYVIMILIFLVIGLMIMFRNKINPQTVITAQAALPGLVIGLIMITFSYFFAGLISDMAFVGTNIVGYYFTAAQGKLGEKDWNDQLSLASTIKQDNVLSLLSPLTGIIDHDNVANSLAAIWPSLENPNRSSNPFDPSFLDPSRVLTMLAAMLITQLLAPFGSMFGGIGQIAVAVGAGGLTIADPRAPVSMALSFIATAVLIYMMFRLLLRLINAYLTIIVLTFTAPFQLLIAALPGKQGIATGWILNMLANILVFPAVLAVLYFVFYLLGPDFINQRCPQCPLRISRTDQVEQNAVVSVAYASDRNRIIDDSTFPMFGGFDLTFLKLILAFGALVALPAIPDIVQRAIGKASQAGELIGRELGSNVGQGRQYAGQFQQGVGGFAGQVGRATDEPGLFYDPDTPGGWRRPTDANEARLAGSRPGQVRRMTGGRYGLSSLAFWRKSKS